MRIPPPVEVPGARLENSEARGKNYQDFKEADGPFDCSATAYDRPLSGTLLSMQGNAESIGLSLVILSVVFACAALIRRWSRPLRKLFIPTAVIGGFLVLGLGPEGLGRLIGGSGLFPEDVFAIWRQMPGLLVIAMSASLLLGERLPPLKTIWSISGPHVIMNLVMAMGQLAVAGSSSGSCSNPYSESTARRLRSSRCRSQADTALWPA